MDADSFIRFIETNDVLTGKFEFRRNEDLMDLDFVNKKFIDFELRGGDYASGSFINCTFDKVLFKDLTLVGVGFTNCDFIDCKFSHVESDFSLSNCRIGHFTVAKNL
ncbi:hypothetical protein HZC20_01270 [Candidatus Peregrinibacteria bacterium]|nr:hypothetical protein [Candidatus Peregrinibacteria bacterium]